MRNLLNFLIKYNSWILFLLLEVACFILLFRFNNYQGSVFFTSANRFAGRVYEWAGGIHSYFYLRTANEKLLDRNLFLERKVEWLTEALAGLQQDSAQVNVRDSALSDVRIIKARVVNNTLNRLDNYITLDKGSADGVKNDMGVVGIEGVAGIVYLVSPHYSLAISVLNRKSSINCKVQGTDYFGYLKWDGGDSRYAYVRDLPRYAEIAVGDTVVLRVTYLHTARVVMRANVTGMAYHLAGSFLFCGFSRCINLKSAITDSIFQVIQSFHSSGTCVPFLNIYYLFRNRHACR